MAVPAGVQGELAALVRGAQVSRAPGLPGLVLGPIRMVAGGLCTARTAVVLLDNVVSVDIF